MSASFFLEFSLTPPKQLEKSKSYILPPEIIKYILKIKYYTFRKRFLTESLNFPAPIYPIHRTSAAFTLFIYDKNFSIKGKMTWIVLDRITLGPIFHVTIPKFPIKTSRFYKKIKY